MRSLAIAIVVALLDLSWRTAGSSPPATSPAPPAASTSTSTASASPASPAPSSMTVADLRGKPPGTYVVDAFVVREDFPCPPCPPKVPCTPCPPSQWRIADGPDKTSPGLGVGLPEFPPMSLASGARYRLRLDTTNGRQLTALLARLAPPPHGNASDDCDVCVSHRVEWGQTPVLGPWTTYTLTPCRTFSRALAGVVKPTSCSATLACAPNLGRVQIENYLRSTDVTGALAHAPSIFGRDVRAADGAMFRIAVDGKEILLGPPCEKDQAGCTPAPDGVTEFAALLRRVSLVTTDEHCQSP